MTMPTFENGGNPKSATSLSFVRRRELILSWSSTIVNNDFYFTKTKDVKAKGQPHLKYYFGHCPNYPSPYILLG